MIEGLGSLDLHLKCELLFAGLGSRLLTAGLGSLDLPYFGTPRVVLFDEVSVVDDFVVLGIDEN